MKIIIKKTTDVTAPLQAYIEEKFMPLEKFVKSFDKAGEAEIFLEVSRASRHHRKGDVFMATADLRLSGKVLRGEASAPDIRTAIDKTRDMLHAEIEKHKTKLLNKRKK